MSREDVLAGIDGFHACLFPQGVRALLVLSELGAHIIELGTGVVHTLSLHTFECPRAPLALDGYWSPAEKGRSIFAATDVAGGPEQSPESMYEYYLVYL